MNTTIKTLIRKTKDADFRDRLRFVADVIGGMGRDWINVSDNSLTVE